MKNEAEDDFTNLRMWGLQEIEFGFSLRISHKFVENFDAALFFDFVCKGLRV